MAAAPFFFLVKLSRGEGVSNPPKKSEGLSPQTPKQDPPNPQTNKSLTNPPPRNLLTVSSHHASFASHMHRLVYQQGIHARAWVCTVQVTGYRLQ